jgi:hypothetical protein
LCTAPALLQDSLTEIEVRQLPALPQDSCKPLSPGSSEMMRHQPVINVSCLITNCSFSAAVRLRTSAQKKLLRKRTTADRRILSTISLTPFEVLLSMIVLPAAQVLHQSSEGMASRAAAKGASAASSNGCVIVAGLVVHILSFCEAGCLPFSVSPFPPASLAAACH